VRFVAIFVLVLGAVLGLTWIGADGDKSDEPEFVATDNPTPTPTAMPQPTATPVPTSTPEPTPTPEPTRFTLAFSGEILSHGPVINQAAVNGDADLAYNYEPMFAEVAPLLEAADFAVCHVETPISDDNVSLSGYPIFNAPREMAEGLKASGYDACSTASNHSYDKGAAGVLTTLNVMEEAGLPQAGMARTAEEQATPVLYEVGPLTIGHLSFTYGLNGFVLPADQPYLVDVTTVDAVVAAATAAREAGADIVVLSIQWGNEYQVDPSQAQIDQATAFLKSDDIDIIIGAHVHVVQPLDVINGKYVFYGIGNFLSNQSASCCPAASQNGVMVYVDIEGSAAGGYEIVEVSFVPTRVDRTDYTIVPLSEALESDELDETTRQLYQDVIASTTEVLTRRGAAIEVRPFD
jgi:poly-gamma-glutamate capsule biosynthesis protein CapA/YwtB (metallophosphatase superfamily)